MASQMVIVVLWLLFASTSNGATLRKRQATDAVINAVVSRNGQTYGADYGEKLNTVIKADDRTVRGGNDVSHDVVTTNNPIGGFITAERILIGGDTSRAQGSDSVEEGMRATGRMPGRGGIASVGRMVSAGGMSDRGGECNATSGECDMRNRNGVFALIAALIRQSMMRLMAAMMNGRRPNNMTSEGLINGSGIIGGGGMMAGGGMMDSGGMMGSDSDSNNTMNSRSGMMPGGGMMPGFGMMLGSGIMPGDIVNNKKTNNRAGMLPGAGMMSGIGMMPSGGMMPGGGMMSGGGMTPNGYGDNKKTNSRAGMMGGRGMMVRGGMMVRAGIIFGRGADLSNRTRYGLINMILRLVNGKRNMSGWNTTHSSGTSGSDVSGNGTPGSVTPGSGKSANGMPDTDSKTIRVDKMAEDSNGIHVKDNNHNKGNNQAKFRILGWLLKKKKAGLRPDLLNLLRKAHF